MNNIIQRLHLLRPAQWTKNIFVFTGVIFGKALEVPELLMQVVLAATTFCMISSAVYIMNDIADRENDKNHPKKRFRPVAAGTVSVAEALIYGVILAIGSLTVGAYVSSSLLLILITYLIINIAYTLWLKQVVILDVFCIAAGFMLRILAGTVGVGIPPSNWLLLCGLMMTLFLGFAKRRAEILTLAEKKEEHRRVLSKYGPILLDEIIAICATGVIMGYSLYTMSPDTIRIHKTENLIYTVPFVIYALFRYIYLLHHSSKAGDPTTDLFKDAHIIIAVIGWAVATYTLLH